MGFLCSAKGQDDQEYVFLPDHRPLRDIGDRSGEDEDSTGSVTISAGPSDLPITETFNRRRKHQLRGLVAPLEEGWFVEHETTGYISEDIQQ